MTLGSYLIQGILNQLSPFSPPPRPLPLSEWKDSYVSHCGD